MLILPNLLAALLGTFRGLLSGRVWQQVQVLVVGAILCLGKRPVSAGLRVMGLAADRRYGVSPGVESSRVVESQSRAAVAQTSDWGVA
jgi:hypothetical protein